MKTTQEAPRAARYVATTVTTSTRGATIERSSSTRAPNTSSRMSGKTTNRSRAAPSRSSMREASLPETNVLPATEGSSAMSWRKVSTASRASEVPGRASSTASTWTTPSPEAVVRAEETTEDPSTVASTSASSAVESTRAGSAEPAGKDSASRSEAEIASGSSRNCSDWLSPVRMPRPGRASATSTREETTATATGRRPTSLPTAFQTRAVSTVVGSPRRGARGQKIQRPKRTRAAGRAVITIRAAITMPTALARPSPRVDGVRDSSRVRTPTTTVVEELSTASAVRCRARAIARCRDSSPLSSSR